MIAYTETAFVVYLKFKFNRASCIVIGQIWQQLRTTYLTSCDADAADADGP